MTRMKLVMPTMPNNIWRILERTGANMRSMAEPRETQGGHDGSEGDGESSRDWTQSALCFSCLSPDEASHANHANPLAQDLLIQGGQPNGHTKAEDDNQENKEA